MSQRHHARGVIAQPVIIKLQLLCRFTRERTATDEYRAPLRFSARFSPRASPLRSHSAARAYSSPKSASFPLHAFSSYSCAHTTSPLSISSSHRSVFALLDHSRRCGPTRYSARPSCVVYCRARRLYDTTPELDRVRGALSRARAGPSSRAHARAGVTLGVTVRHVRESWTNAKRKSAMLVECALGTLESVASTSGASDRSRRRAVDVAKRLPHVR